MNEQVVSFETANLAKEKEFNWNCKYFYYNGKNESLYGTKSCVPNMEYNNHDYTQLCTAPTQSELQKWLREEHKIHIEVYIDMKCKYTTLIYTFKNDDVVLVKNKEYKSKIYNTYEEALEDALKESLKIN